MSQSQCGATVGRYPAVKLMERIPVAGRTNPLVRRPWNPLTPPGIKPPFGRLSPGPRMVGYALLTRAPVATTTGKPAE